LPTPVFPAGSITCEQGARTVLANANTVHLRRDPAFTVKSLIHITKNLLAQALH
jgi:hypothetical protein